MVNHFTNDGFRNIEFDLYKSDIDYLKREWKQYLKTIAPYPSHYTGKGIVMCAGGLSYFTCCWLALHALRRVGCNLPIEIWYVGNELSPEILSALEKLHVTCINFLQYPDAPTVGYRLKPYAIIHSSFREVLYLDADNICVKDPAHLFNAEEYLSTGALFWPDFWKTGPTNPIWAIVDSKEHHMQEQESGQVLINKEKCWKELNLCHFFNLRWDIYYSLLLGDKDTFRFAWLACKTPFYMIPTAVGTLGYLEEASNEFVGNTMVQHDLTGEVCFLHRNLLKWDVTRHDEFVWHTIKRFKTGAAIKVYDITHSAQLGHAHMNLGGDVEALDFKTLYPGLEQELLQLLNELRDSPFYARYMIYLHKKPC